MRPRLKLLLRKFSNLPTLPRRVQPMHVSSVTTQ
jgi:hypothetical protein